MPFAQPTAAGAVMDKKFKKLIHENKCFLKKTQEKYTVDVQSK